MLHLSGIGTNHRSLKMLNEKFCTFLNVRKVPKEAPAVKKFNESSTSFRNELNSPRHDLGSDSNSFGSSGCLDSIAEFFQGGGRDILLKSLTFYTESNPIPPMRGSIINQDLTSESNNLKTLSCFFAHFAVNIFSIYHISTL